jgi:acetyl esterase/lipase
LNQIRASEATSAKPPTPDVAYSARRIPGARGAPEVTLYVINPKPGSSRPGILHTHGGGFVWGMAKNEIRGLQGIAKELDCTIVTVEYRLAPEALWSDSLEDNYAGLKWLHANAGSLGVDRARIAVMGESAGGGHAALLAHTARDRGEVPLAFQCLVYPMLDDRTASVHGVPAHIGWIGWTPEKNRYGWTSFLGQAPGTSSVPPAVPARFTNLEGLPPAWIGVGAIDLFVEEDIAYASRLMQSGVMTELVVVPGAPHGFDAAPDLAGVDIPICRQFTQAKMAALRRALIE